MKLRTIFLLPLFTSLLLLGSCEFGSAPGPEGGGGTEGQGVSLSGRLVTTSGSPLVGARVRISPSDSASTLAKGAVVNATFVVPAVKADSTLTNAEGRFTLSHIAKGTYDVSASFQRGDTLLSLFIPNLVINGNIDMGTDTVRASGSILVKVKLPEGQEVEGALCQIAETPWRIYSDGDGNCVLIGIPAGTYKVTVTHPSYPGGLSTVIGVVPGAQANGGIVLLSGSPMPPEDTTGNGGNGGIDTTGIGGIPPVNPQHLLAHFPFNEGSGSVAQSIGSAALSAAAVNGAQWTTGVNGSSLVFNGTTNSVVLQNARALTGMSKLTVESWVKLTQYGGPYQRIAAVWSGSVAAWTLTVFDDGYFGIEVYAGSSSSEDKDSRSRKKVPLNEWTHLTGVYSGDSIVLYMNGERVYAKPSIKKVLPLIQQRLEVGCILDPNTAAVTFSWPGSIDELKVYDTTLTDGQVLASYLKNKPTSSGGGGGTPVDALSKARYFDSTAATVALWTFNGYENGVVRDQGKNGFHLTPSSASGLPLSASPVGSAVSIEGTAKRFSVPYDDRLNVGGTGRLTYEARIFMSAYPATTNHKSRVALVGMYAGIQMQVHANGAIYLKAQKLTPSATWYDTLHTAPATVPLNRWVNVAIAVDTTVSPKQVYAYIDGVPVQMVGTASDNAFRVYSAPFTVGGDSQDGQTFTGRIEEVRVSNTLVLGPGLPLVP